MKVIINFDRREIHLPESPIGKMGEILNRYFPQDKWEGFEIMIDDRVDEDTDIGRKLQIPY